MDYDISSFLERARPVWKVDKSGQGGRGAVGGVASLYFFEYVSTNSASSVKRGNARAAAVSWQGSTWVLGGGPRKNRRGPVVMVDTTTMFSRST